METTADGFVLRLPDLMTETAARLMANFCANKLGRPVAIERGGATIDSVAPGGRRVARPGVKPREHKAEYNANLTTALAHLLTAFKQP